MPGFKVKDLSCIRFCPLPVDGNHDPVKFEGYRGDRKLF